MSKIIVIGEDSLAIAAGRIVTLLADRGIVDHAGQDEAGNYIGGETLLYLNDADFMLVEVEELPEPWIPGAYRWYGEAFHPVEDSEAWLAYEAARAASFAALVREYDGHVEARIERQAREMGYGNPNNPNVSAIDRAVTYADEPAVPKFQAEGRLLRAWRSLYWAACWPVLEAVRAGQRAVPEPAELLAELDAAAPPPSADAVVAEVARMAAAS